jgi:hypothetical protein
MPDERVSGHGGEHPEGQHGQGPAAPTLQSQESPVLQAQNIRSTLLQLISHGSQRCGTGTGTVGTVTL